MSEREEEAGATEKLGVGSQEPPTFYVNNAYATAGPWDVQIRFGHNVVTEDGVVQKWDVQIIQSPTQAKAFLRILAQQLMNFEEDYGVIPDILAMMESKAQQGYDDEDSAVVSAPSPSSPLEHSPSPSPKAAVLRPRKAPRSGSDRTVRGPGRRAR